MNYLPNTGNASCGNLYNKHTRMRATISSSDGSNPVAFTADVLANTKVNLPTSLNGYKITGNIETETGGVWTSCTSFTYSGTASLGSNNSLPLWGSFIYCWSPVEKQSFAISGGDYGDYLTISKIKYTNPPSTWLVSMNSIDWVTLTMPAPKNGYIPETGSVGPYYLIDRDMLRNVLGSTFYGKPIYFRSKYSNDCFSNNTSDPTTSPFVFALKPTVTLTSYEDARCKGESSGTATLNIQHPDVDRFIITCKNLDNSAYDFQIPAASRGDNVVSGLRAGSWQFIVENNNSVNASDYGAAYETFNHTVREPALPLRASTVSKKYGSFDVSCNGGSNGEITASAIGGNGTYTYTWSHDAALTSATASGLKAGTYTVTATDYKGCVNSTSITLLEPTKLTASLTSTGGKGAYQVSCWDKSDGALLASGSGGASGYTYTWSTGATGNTISGLSVNSYTVTVKDANTCTAQSSVTLTAPPKIDFSINELASLTCPNDHTAILEAKPVASTIIGTAHYDWSTGETISTIEDKGAGTYSVKVSDDQGCSTTKSKTLVDPPANTVSISPLSNYNGSYIKCNGDSNGSLAAIVKDENNNTITAQNYSWTVGSTTVGDGATLSSVSDLNEGQYKVVITYRNQCKAEATYFLSDPEPVTVAVSTASNYNGQPISCYNMTDGKLHAIASGGTGTLTFSWNTGATGSLLTNIGAGFYTVTIKDVNGCIGTQTQQLQNPEPVQAVITDVSDYSGYGISCYGSSDGYILAEGTGGTGVYTYSWSNGNTSMSINKLVADVYTVTVSDNNACKQSISQTITSPPTLSLSVANQKNVSCFDGNDGAIELKSSGGVGNYTYSNDSKTTWQAGNTFNSLKQGSYTIYLQDANGCEKNIAATLTQPTKISISFTNIQPAFCSNPTGTATAVVTGGTTGYTYSWQDSKSSEVDTDAILSNVKSGIYTLVVQDKNACPMTNSVAITSNDGAKSTYTATAAKCFDSFDGSASIVITEGDGPFVTEWPDGQSSLQGINLGKGTYNVLITDSHNCTVVQAVDIPAPDALQLAVKSATIPTCNGVCDGQLTLEATGGVGGYIYEWNNKAGEAQPQLCAAVYPVVLKDANGCILTQDVELKHPDPIQITVVSATLPTCKDGCDGSLEVTANGGNGGYNYIWSVGGNSAIKTNLCPGVYTVSVEDAKGCKGENTVTLNNTPELLLNLGGGVTLCVGQRYTLDAGAGWNSIAWGSSAGLSSVDQKVTVNEAGRYWVEVLSDKGCVAQDTFLLETSYDLLKAAFLMQSQAAVGDTVVMIDVSWPLPETIEWNYPLEMTKLLDNGDVVYGQYKNTGVYEVTLGSHLGECYDQISKTITIIEGEEDTEGGRLGYEESVKQFTLYPNPNNGSFHVGVELIREMPITVSVWHSPTGILIKQVQKSGDKQYEIYFDLKPLTSGTYVLRLDYENGKKYIRFVVN
ncbi:T9SS type A sorting domain-containing protein [Ohtaekwangia koreensis]|nr:T9SS type A sorting domain-containing protein [Ohtaekwangia koreensis]